MLQYLKRYLQFWLKSTNEHGVHSPFVFDFVTKCLYDKSVFPDYTALQNNRKSLYKNKQIIEVTDFGSGSKIFKTNHRAVHQIAKTAGITPKRARLLYRITRYFEPNHILELGTSLGLATASLSLGNPKAKITTVEGCPKTAHLAAQHFQKMSIQNIDLQNIRFDDFFSTIPKTQQYQLIYIDGNHSETATIAYFEQLLPHISAQTILILDDINWSDQMQNAWKTIKIHPKVTATIDTFGWGILFFRTEQKQEQFTIRF